MTSAPSPRILVVDDDPGLREVLVDYLGQHGFEAMGAASAAEMDRQLEHRPPDLVVLDLMMPGEDGLSACRRLIARGGPPVVMLSAMGEETDRIVGLELGADDYLPKPCNPRELLARIRAVLRRRAGPEAPGASAAEPVLAFDGRTLNLLRRELTRPDGTVTILSALLKAFAESPRRVLSRDQLLERARGSETEVFDRAMDVQISRLRKKLADADGRDPIQTLRGEGYMFDATVDRRMERPA